MPGHATFYWNELMTRDVEAAKRFFADTLGWSYDAMPMQKFTYWIAKSQDQVVCGLMTMPDTMPKDVPSRWVSYLEVDDVDKRMADAVTAGATVKMEPFDVPDVGRIAMLSDPTGAVVGWITPVRKS